MLIIQIAFGIIVAIFLLGIIASIWDRIVGGPRIVNGPYKSYKDPF